MAKPTKQQVLDEADEQKLNEWAAVYCMSLEKGTKLGETAWCDSNGRLLDDHGRYTPCQDKAQAFDLMVKFELFVNVDRGVTTVCYFGQRGSPDIVNVLPQIAIVKAALCKAIGERDEQGKVN